MAAIKTLLILVFLSVLINGVYSKGTSFPIGGLFNKNTLHKSRVAFETIGTTSSKSYFARLIYPSVTDTFSTALEVCENTSYSNSIVALIDGRPTEGICDVVCQLCNRLNIVHLALGWQPIDTMEDNLFTFSYYPPPYIVSEAYATLIKDLGWDKFSILYEDDSSFIRLQDIIGTWPHNKEAITFRQLDPGGDNREVFKYVFKIARLSHHVIECAIENIPLYMKQILQVENSTQYQSFILTNLDSRTVDFTALPNMVANISTMYMATPDPTRWLDYHIDPGVQMETALAADALMHLEKAIVQMKQDLMEMNEDSDMAYQLGLPPALCFGSSREDAWSSGELLRQALIKTVSKGFTGNIEFDSEGRRTNFELHYSKINMEGKFEDTGHWNSSTKIITMDKTVPDRSIAQRNGTITVVSRREKPYFSIIENEDGTRTMRGYAVDLATMIFEIINEDPDSQFEVQFKEVDDGKYGSPIEGTKKWDGIIGELMEHKADMGILDLGITSERNAVVDFSTPFMSTGISMLFKQREPETPDMFSFINPLSLDVWLYLMTTYIIVSFVILICARMSSDDWVNPHPCNQNPENLQNIWSLYNCMWLTMGSIMTQGCDILPRGLGSRWTTGFWYFFAMIVTASYTANMSTFLSNSRRTSDITDAKQLADQSKISYGAVVNSSTYKFFKNSNDTVYSKLWQVMESSQPTVFMHSNDEGRDRVLRSKGNYAFFMESTAIKYFTERDCKNLTMVGSPLDSKAYGIAMPKNFPHKEKVDRAILSLQESGKLTDLADKWWKIEDNASPCVKTEEIDDGGSLQMKNTSGIFLVLGVGAILGLIVAVIDFLLHARQISVKEKVTFKEALASEWHASLNPRVLAKSAAPPRSVPTTRSPSPMRERSTSRAVSVLRAASSFINFDEIY